VNTRDLASRRWRTFAEGLLAGFSGALVFSLIHLVYDIASGTPLRTPALLDAALFEGGAAARGAQPELATLLRFSLLHVGGWGVAGIVSSVAVCFVERRPSAWLVVFGGIVAVFISYLYLAGVFSIPGEAALHLWLGTVLGAATLATVLALRHPDLRGRIEREGISGGEREAVESALAVEGRCLALQRLLLERYAVDGPMAEIASARERRMNALVGICERYALPVPSGELALGNEEPGSLEAACRAALAAEQDAIDLYDRLLVAVVEPRIRETFLRHRWESHDEHLQVYESCVARRTA
jgi:hypothetical protein